MKRILIVICALAWSICAIASDAVAHSPNVYADCTGVRITLANYEGNATNNVFHLTRDNGPVLTIPYAAALIQTVTWLNVATDHTYTWSIDANIHTGDPTQWDVPLTTGDVSGCDAPIPTTTTTGVPPSTTQSPSQSTTTTPMPSSTVPPSTSGTTVPESSTPVTSVVTPATTSPAPSSTPSTTQAPLPTTTPTTPNTPSPTVDSSTPVPGVTNLPPPPTVGQLPVTGTAAGNTAAVALILLTVGLAVLMVVRPQKSKRK